MKNQTNLYQSQSQISVTGFVQGESIEENMRRIMETREGIDNVAPMIYTERKDGVLAQYDIRTDRWELAQEAMDKVSKYHLAKREERLKAAEEQQRQEQQQEQSKTE